MLKQALVSKSFMPLWVSHLLSVVNDGFIRTVFLFFVTYKMTQTGSVFTITAVILYALCYCFASCYAGQIADKISRVRFLRLIRASEIALMGMALLFVFMDSRILLTLIFSFLSILTSRIKLFVSAMSSRWMMLTSAFLNPFSSK